uniref:Uncharacterized protein n=1 Tax=Anopheles culicifacies TaxID=139723 RepID=A0A182MHB7_9DIPT
MHIPQGCVVKNIRIKQKLARLRHQQRMLAQHLQHLEESPNASPALIRQQHQRYNNLLRYYSSWDKVYTSTADTSRPSSTALDGASSSRALHAAQRLGEPYSSGPVSASHHQQYQQRQQHPRRWLKKRSRAHADESRTGDERAGMNHRVTKE